MAMIKILVSELNSGIQIAQLLGRERLLRLKDFMRTFGFAHRSVFIRFVTYGLQDPEFALEFLAKRGNILFERRRQVTQLTFARSKSRFARDADVVFGLHQTIPNILGHSLQLRTHF